MVGLQFELASCWAGDHEVFDASQAVCLPPSAALEKAIPVVHVEKPLLVNAVSGDRVPAMSPLT